jgi:hypothetical protein
MDLQVLSNQEGGEIKGTERCGLELYTIRSSYVCARSCSPTLYHSPDQPSDPQLIPPYPYTTLGKLAYRKSITWAGEVLMTEHAPHPA